MGCQETQCEPQAERSSLLELGSPVLAAPGLYRLIPLTQGKYALVDAADYDWLSQWRWGANWNGDTRKQDNPPDEVRL